MIWAVLLLAALIVFMSRYLLVEPRLPIRLSPAFRGWLAYASPAVLTAIAAPIIFAPSGEFSLSLTGNPYLAASVVAIVVAWKSKHILLTAGLSMLVFVILNQGFIT